MPTQTHKADAYIRKFLSKYEDGAWAGIEPELPDKKDRTNKAIDALVTRISDGKKLAIEHTTIMPFQNEIEDCANFETAGFLEIEKDTSLLVPDRWTQVFVPVGILEGRSKSERTTIVNSVHNWLKQNITNISIGSSKQQCPVGLEDMAEIELNFIVKVTLGGSFIKIGRQQITNDLNLVVQKALKEKPPKLVASEADKRILLLERQHWNLLQGDIIGEIRNQSAAFPDVAKVDEIWFVETRDYEQYENLHFEPGTNSHALGFSVLKNEELSIAKVLESL